MARTSFNASPKTPPAQRDVDVAKRGVSAGGDPEKTPATRSAGGHGGKSLGLAACTAIVVGNMVGSGFYLSPSAVAPYGVLAIVMWMVMAVGAMCLGLVFARLSRAVPQTGGPYAYSKLAFGDFGGFLVAWGYWMSIWTSLPPMALAFTGSFVELVPSLRGSRPLAVGLTLGAIWLVVLTNLRGVRTAGLVAEVTTYSKLVPFAAVALLGLFFVDPANLSEFNPSGEPLLTSMAALAPLTMFAFLGLESATVPAGDVIAPERTIPRATLYGVSIAALLYVLGTIVAMGVVPRSELVGSPAPFVDVARVMGGSWAAAAIGLAVMLSSLGALNGWTLLMGQVPMAAARDGLFPAIFRHLSARGVPAFGIVVSALLATALVLIQAVFGSGFAAIYGAIVGLATMTAVVPYAFSSVAGALIGNREAGGIPRRITAVEAVAFVFSVFIIYGCGAEPVLFGFLLLLAGIPVYVGLRRARPPATFVAPA
jgi:arginine:agmatine antiporter